MSHQPSEAVEMYLRTVLELEEEGVPALRARLSERLGLSAPAVSEGVSRLEQSGLVVLQPDRHIELTEQGRERAEHVMRKHRLAERLLVDVLGLDHEHVHEEACRWEHVISDRVEAKLLEFLGNPTTSPYGNPIPGATPGDHEPVSLASIDAAEVTISYISERLQSDHDVVSQLREHGMWTGAQVAVERSPDVVRLRTDGHEVELPADDAKLVFVTPV
ncbi:metal-dependent transcriptional regulator [Egicoccus halophilus]|uniref:Iron-dependent repressor IdeR n=1 Tax=Egicoccus halophilus TaxID=1670830 RepID=A0A8J3ABR7_9ACTN|nr:metal-dependent transcriptional regulator [Egicoccus halophilus]GGI07788.1 iron-dependent repressor IdeR [Egicoccus halophilus]